MQRVLLRTLVLLWAGLAFSLGIARANDFNVIFTDSLTDNSLVGSGTFDFDGNLGDGTYLLSSLTNVNFDFTVDGATFTNSDLDTSNLANIEVVIYEGGNNFYFDTDCFNTPGCYSKEADAALDFVDQNFGYILATVPNDDQAPPLDFYGALGPGGVIEGYYGTLAGLAPEPGTLLLLGTGLAGMLLRRSRRA
jgi:hypothetical protein